MSRSYAHCPRRRDPFSCCRPAVIPSLLIAAAGLVAGAALGSDRGGVDPILNAAGADGGLVLHIGCGDGHLTAALRAGDRFRVHGLDTEWKNVQQARAYIRAQGLGGSVSIDRFDGRHLPLIDNQVNLVVAEDLGGVNIDEVRRVLCPGGVACIKRDGKWTKTVKPRPENIDDWTHFLHGPDNNAVAQDDVVGFPYHLQWIGSPEHSRDHEITTSMDVMVSAGGRVFYILDEGPTALSHYLPSRWFLVARDAFNGIVLWKHPLAEWQPYQVHGRTSLAADLWRRLVAAEDAVYVTPTIFGPVTALDPATGRTLRTYAGTDRTEEIICSDGVLYLVATTSRPDRIDRRQLAQSRVTPDQKRIMAVRAATGEILWSKQDQDTAAVHPLTLAVSGDRVFFQNTQAVVCLDAAKGHTLWRFARPSRYAMPGHTTPTLVVADDVVLSADRVRRSPARREDARNKAAQSHSELIALSAADGKELWRCPCEENVGAGVDVFVANGLVWVGEVPRRKTSDYNHGRDLHTGRIKKTFSHEENWPIVHHHRCYRDKATKNYILAGRTGIEFIDLTSGKLTPHRWTRGVCEYGIMPCNGLIYSPPDQCACYIESKVHGFYGMAPQRKSTEPRSTSGDDAERLEHGPAYSQIINHKSEIINPDEWPTYRRDNRRSGFAPGSIPESPSPVWRTRLGGKLTSLVSASGRVYGAQADARTVFCLDADTGRRVWRFEAGGRVDSPPSIAGRLAVFGCRDGWVYALDASDGRLAWRYRAAPEDLRLVEQGELASVWPVHGSVLIEGNHVFCAAGRSSYLDGGMYLYQLDLQTGRPLIRKRYCSRDPKTGERVLLYTPFDGELLPGREWPGLLPDILSADDQNFYLRSVPLTRDLAIRDKVYVPHLFCSLGFLEDTWWERTYWIYGSHFYSGARGHAYARTLFPGGRLLVFDDQSVYGYQDPELNASGAGIFRVAKNPPFIDIASAAASAGGGKSRRRGAAAMPEALRAKIRETFVWKNGIPQHPEAMQLTGAKGGVGDRIRRITKYRFAWQQEVPLYPNAMLLTERAVVMAGPPRFDEQTTSEYLASAETDRFELTPPLEDALETFEGRKGGVLYIADKADGRRLAQVRLPSAPVFDGMIAAAGRLFLSLKDGSVVCLDGKKTGTEHR